MHTKFLPGNLRGRDHAKGLGVDGKKYCDGSQVSREGRCGLNSSG